MQHPDLKPHARELVSRITIAVEEANGIANDKGLDYIRLLLLQIYRSPRWEERDCHGHQGYAEGHVLGHGLDRPAG